MNRKYLLIGLGVIVAAGATYLIIHRIKGNKIYKQLEADLQTGTNETGTIQDLTISGQALNPNYWKTSNSQLLSASAEIDGVKKLKDWIGSTYWFSDKPAILSFFKNLQNKAQVSQIADYYQKTYGTSLLDDLQTIDYTVLGISYTTQYLPQIKSAINALPA